MIDNMVEVSQALRMTGIKSAEKLRQQALAENLKFYQVANLIAYDYHDLTRYIHMVERNKLIKSTGKWRNGRVRSAEFDRVCSCGGQAVFIQNTYVCQNMGDGQKHEPASKDAPFEMVENVISADELCERFGINNRERFRQWRSQEGINIVRIGGEKSRQAVYLLADVERYELTLRRTEIAKKAGVWKSAALIRSTQFDEKCICGGFAFNYQGFHCENSGDLQPHMAEF